MSGDEPTFDPRHDPIYQRGYRGDAEKRPGAMPPGERASAHRSDAVTPGEPAARGATPSNAEVPHVPGDSPAPVAESPRNPYFLALWITAVALIAAGIGLEWRSVAVANYGYSSAGEVSLEAIIQQLTWVVAPIMITVGALTIVALLFWHAIHWRAPQQREGRLKDDRRDADSGRSASWS